MMSMTQKKIMMLGRSLSLDLFRSGYQLSRFARAGVVSGHDRASERERERGRHDRSEAGTEGHAPTATGLCNNLNLLCQLDAAGRAGRHAPSRAKPEGSSGILQCCAVESCVDIAEMSDRGRRGWDPSSNSLCSWPCPSLVCVGFAAFALRGPATCRFSASSWAATQTMTTSSMRGSRRPKTAHYVTRLRGFELV